VELGFLQKVAKKGFYEAILRSLSIDGAAFQPRIAFTPAVQIAAGKPLPPIKLTLKTHKLTPMRLRGGDGSATVSWIKVYYKLNLVKNYRK